MRESEHTEAVGAEREEAEREEAEREEAERARTVTQRAIRRLDILEWVIFGVGAVLATFGGGLVAWLVSGVSEWDFRSTWIGASLLLFVVPGTIAIIKIKREEREDTLRAAAIRERQDG